MQNETRAQREERIVKSLLRQQSEYRKAQEEAAKEGFRPQYCIHGTNQWTDYDNICPGCEDGAFTEHSSREDIETLARKIADNEERIEGARRK